MISERGWRLSQHDPFLVKAHFRCAADPFDPETNPGGYINFGTAENLIAFDLLEPLLREAQEIYEPDTHYNELHGAGFFREAIAGFLGRRAGRRIERNNLAVASGASAILEELAFVLCDPGETILIPAPYYSGFDHDLALRSEARLRHIPLTVPDFSLAVDDIQRSYREAKAEGITVKAILLNSPQNPLGQVYSKELMEGAAALAEREGFHLILDEIYAESLMPGVRHFSGLTLESGLVHVVYGFAKDFGLSGYKVGVLHSENMEVMRAVQDSTYFYSVSVHTQRTLANLLANPGLGVFFEAYRQRLAAAYTEVCANLANSNIPFLPVEGGIVVWFDLRSFLSDASFEAERRLFEHMFERYRVNISPGRVFHCTEPGWFRLCFAVPEPHRREGLRRLIEGVTKGVTQKGSDLEN
jgi:aspartate/methionine/tyrosine aminotransferase